MKTNKKIDLTNLVRLYKDRKISLQELYDNSNTCELASEWDMTVPTLVKRLKEKGIKLKGRGTEKKIPF